jgi:hypothetical protein
MACMRSEDPSHPLLRSADACRSVTRSSATSACRSSRDRTGPDAHAVAKRDRPRADETAAYWLGQQDGEAPDQAHQRRPAAMRREGPSEVEGLVKLCDLRRVFRARATVQ